MVDNLWPSISQANYRDISVTRLSARDPVSFPPHSREWFSIIVYHVRFTGSATTADQRNLFTAECCLICSVSPPLMAVASKKPGYRNVDISATRLSARDPVGFPPHPREWLSIIVYRIIASVTASQYSAAAISAVQAESHLSQAQLVNCRTQFYQLQFYTCFNDSWQVFFAAIWL